MSLSPISLRYLAMTFLVTFLFNGCASTPPDVAMPMLSVRSQQSAYLQRFQRADLTLSAEATFVRGRGDQVGLSIHKGEERQLELLRMNNSWYAQGKWVRHTWNGSRAELPRRLRGWAVLLEAYASSHTAPDGTSIQRFGDQWIAILKESDQLIGLNLRDGNDNYRVRFQLQQD